MDCEANHPSPFGTNARPVADPWLRFGQTNILDSVQRLLQHFGNCTALPIAGGSLMLFHSQPRMA